MSNIADSSKPVKRKATNNQVDTRVDELRKIWTGMNKAAGIRDGGYTSRDLNLDDLSYYIHNRIRVLQGKKAHTPDEWFEEAR